MAARTTLVLTDRESTPVDHTFTPDGTESNGVHVFSEKNGIPADDARFTARLQRLKNRYRVQLKLEVPTTQIQTINGIDNPVVVRTAYAEVVLSFDQTSSAAERANVIGMLADSLNADQTQINDMIVGLSDIY